MKILYAASENENAKIQLSRFLQAIEDKPYIVKVAAYKKSSPNINIDWTLDCLKNLFKPDYVTLDNDNFVTYFEQVKYFKPDLIISDLEYFTSHIASVLGTTLWQCSSSIINYALTNEEKYDLGVFKRYAYIFNRSEAQTQRHLNVLDTSDKNFVYSHFGDCETPPRVKPGFEWIKPYHRVGRKSAPCQHNVVGASLGSNKKMIGLLKFYSDSVCFSEFLETHPNPVVKDIRNQEEYFCNLRNSNLFVCGGQTSFLADAFYNGKYSAVLTNLMDPECIVNSTISERLGLSTSIYHISDDLQSMMNKPVPVSLNGNIKYLHERIEEL
jgi:hypothetical protein